MTRRLVYLDVLRVISVFLVMYGHFVLVGGGAKVIPSIINNDTVLPLVDSSRWHVYLFEIFLVESFKTQSSILGVSLFFIITGMLMPMMCDRYSRKDFIVNRFFRIFPPLLVSLIVISVGLYFMQGIVFLPSQYLASLTLSYEFLHLTPITGVLWTLEVEVIFYVISFVMGRYSISRLMFLQSALLFSVLLGTLYPDNFFLWQSGALARYLLMVTIGSAIYLSEGQEDIFGKLKTITPSVLFSYVGFQLFKFGKVDASTYESLGTHLLATITFILFYKVGPYVIRKIPRLLDSVADMVYPIYLLHASLGLAFMAVVRPYWDHPYFLLTSAMTITFVASWFLHRYVEVPSIRLGRKFIRPRQV